MSELEFYSPPEAECILNFFSYLDVVMLMLVRAKICMDIL